MLIDNGLLFGNSVKVTSVSGYTAVTLTISKNFATFFIKSETHWSKNHKSHCLQNEEARSTSRMYFTSSMRENACP